MEFDQNRSIWSLTTTLATVVRHMLLPDNTHPIFYLAMSNRIMQSVTWEISRCSTPSSALLCSPGPEDAAIASSPMKKSRSSVPRFDCMWPDGLAPPVRYAKLFATAGRPDPEPPPPPVAGPLVAIAVGNTKDGESFPAKPGTAS